MLNTGLLDLGRVVLNVGVDIGHFVGNARVLEGIGGVQSGQLLLLLLRVETLSGGQVVNRRCDKNLPMLLVLVMRLLAIVGPIEGLVGVAVWTGPLGITLVLGGQ